MKNGWLHCGSEVVLVDNATGLRVRGENKVAKHVVGLAAVGGVVAAVANCGLVGFATRGDGPCGTLGVVTRRVKLEHINDWVAADGTISTASPVVVVAGPVAEG